MPANFLKLLRFFLVTGLSLFCITCFSQEWQWSVAVEPVVSGETNDHPRAFLWIPPGCRQVRGVVLGQHNMVEEGIFEHPVFRKEMARLHFAEIWVSPNFSIVYDFNLGAGDLFNFIMKALAKESGYSELEFAPVVPIGHSALASYPWNFAAGNPGRTLAAISVHGDAPLTNLTGSGRPNPDWGNRNMDSIPGIMVMGEYEWMEERLKPAFDYRAKHPATPITLFADAGHGHFDYSDDLVSYLALYIRKAALYRLPARVPMDRLVVLNGIDPKKGWLMDRWHKDSVPQAKPAPYFKYYGDEHTASWCFDEEMAKATEAFYTKARGKVNQYLGFVQNGEVVPSVKTHARIHLKFLPGSDGLTFHLSPTFLDTIPGHNGQPATLAAGHGKGSATISRICGPVIKVNDTTFRVSFYRMGMNNPKRTGDIWLLASHPGDEKYKSAVQQANMRIPYPNKEGADQQISFPAIPDQKQGKESVSLKAVSSAGVPVHFYVQEGPAEIKGNKLYFTKIPPRSRYPIKVTVVAWQYGRGNEPKLKTAEPVVRTFFIMKK